MKRRLLIGALALLLVCLSVAPVALLAAHHGHFHMNCTCDVCTVIRDDIALLNLVATALVVLILFRVIAARLREAPIHIVVGSRAPLPVALKVRMNN